MKSRNNVLVNVLILIVGIVFIFMHSRENVINAIVIITGLLFIASGVINLIMTFTAKSRPDGSGAGIASTLACVAAVALGLWMALDPAALVNTIVYIFAALLIIGGAFHIYMLAYGYSPMRFPGWLYIFPALLIIGGISILVIGAPTVVNYIILITGIAMIVFAVNSFLEYAGCQSYRRGQRTLPPQ